MNVLKTSFILALFEILSIPCTYANSLHLIVNVPATTPAQSHIYLTGGNDTLCNWKPDCLELTPTSVPGAYEGVLSFDSSISQIEFKVTRGSWDQEAAAPSGVSLHNGVWNFADPTTAAVAVFSVANWKDLGPKTAPTNLKIVSGVYSPQLQNTRSVRILLPRDYAMNTEQRYPVIYAHDGQNLFDPSTCISGADWSLDLSVKRVISQPANDPIIVGIDSMPGDERALEYDETAKGELYAQFLIETIKPWIDQNLRTLPDRNHTWTMGSSLGGLISLELAWKHSEVFSAAAGLSASIFFNEQDIYGVFGTQIPSFPVRLYFDHGGIGGDAAFAQYSAPFDLYLRNLGFVEGQNLVYLVYPYSDHSEVDWARRVDVPLRWLTGSN